MSDVLATVETRHESQGFEPAGAWQLPHPQDGEPDRDDAPVDRRPREWAFVIPAIADAILALQRCRPRTGGCPARRGSQWLELGRQFLDRRCHEHARLPPCHDRVGWSERTIFSSTTSSGSAPAPAQM
ncbi:MAG: hypothetical protein IT457_24975 [Planctomycetes bacterium]|nr:hypothetical protein [Planctomycetota bacterium]